MLIHHYRLNYSILLIPCSPSRWGRGAILMTTTYLLFSIDFNFYEHIIVEWLLIMILCNAYGTLTTTIHVCVCVKTWQGYPTIDRYCRTCNIECGYVIVRDLPGEALYIYYYKVSSLNKAKIFNWPHAVSVRNLKAWKNRVLVPGFYGLSASWTVPHLISGFSTSPCIAFLR